MTRKIAPLIVVIQATCLLLGSTASPADASPFLCCGSGPSVAEALPQIPPAAPGMARVWFLRLYLPTDPLAEPSIFANGAPVGRSEPGTAFIRDFAPGEYRFSVPSDRVDNNQDAVVQLTAGSESFLEVQSLRGWGSCGDGCERDVLYVRPISTYWPHKYYFATLAYRGFGQL